MSTFAEEELVDMERMARPMDLMQFSNKMRLILKLGFYPVIVCSCHRRTWCYEGTINYTYKMYLEECPCGLEAGPKLLLGDTDAPEI